MCGKDIHNEDCPSIPNTDCPGCISTGLSTRWASTMIFSSGCGMRGGTTVGRGKPVRESEGEESDAMELRVFVREAPIDPKSIAGVGSA
ncbi:hypothetical protein PISMIDRAFT_389984 [Pisolithus microcarpus 441]|uniref:Uncharacterized protein n=1 Tax=Pisolithus microcarpus 441 TaxID=765257 RepID=A0A0C9YYL7_9AGAM|nr:hypothetical protein PISMIDRAFT_389984 [Pisolithus microcarpus 441]